MDGPIVYNFSAGPCVLPKPVLQQAQAELLNWQGKAITSDICAGTGVSVLEMSHRSKWYDSIVKENDVLLRDVFNVPETHEIFWFGGGATPQFTAIPYNLLGDKQTANQLVTG